MKGLGTVRTRIRGRISAILTVSYFNCKLDNNCDFTICFYQNSFRAVESVTGNPKSSKHRDISRLFSRRSVCRRQMRRLNLHICGILNIRYIKLLYCTCFCGVKPRTPACHNFLLFTLTSLRQPALKLFYADPVKLS